MGFQVPDTALIIRKDITLIKRLTCVTAHGMLAPIAVPVKTTTTRKIVRNVYLSKSPIVFCVPKETKQRVETNQTNLSLINLTKIISFIKKNKFIKVIKFCIIYKIL